ncbi:MAG: ABC transporter permease [Candidatus Neomarinimicrobiota bacterium]
MILYLQFALRYFYKKDDWNFSSNAISLAIIGLAIGIFSLLMTISVINGFEEVLSNKIIRVDGKIRLKTILDSPIKESENLDALIISSNSGIKIKPYIRGSAILFKNKITEAIILEGVEYLNDYDETGNEKIFIEDDQIIIGNSLGNNIDLGSNEILMIAALSDFDGNPLSLKYNKLFVKGKFKTGMDEYDKGLAYVNIKTAQKLFKMKGMVSGYIINSNNELDIFVDDLNEIIKYPYFIESWKDRHQIIFQWINTQKLPIIIIFGLIALVGIINILATISLMINEKSTEIAIMSALGFKKNQIRKIYILQAGLVGLVGSLIGSFTSFFCIYFQNKYNIIPLPGEVYFMDSLPVSFSYSICIIVIIMTFFISIFSGLLPTRSIFKYKVSDLLAKE